MAVDARPVTPLSQQPPSYTSAMVEKSGPTDPAEREALHLPPKSYADAAEQALTQEDPPIDEDAIKESPPRPVHTRNSSEPRALAEVIDDAERTPPPGSPVLRHPRGRLENKVSRESYFGPAKHHASSTNGSVNGDGAQHRSRPQTPETLDGVGRDHTPRSSIHRSHRPSSSRSTKSLIDGEKPQGKNGEQGGVIYEQYRNKSGENLVSIVPPHGDDLSLQQRENKPPGPESGPHGDDEQSNNELVSGKRAGAGWSKSAIRFAPLNIPLQRRLQTLLVLLHTLSIVTCLAFFFLCCAIPLLWPLIVPYLIYVLLSPASIDGKLTHRSERLRSSRVWSLFGSYFPARLHRTQTLEPTRKYIFGYHPHGIISHGAYVAFATEALGFGQLFPGITNTLLTLDTNFRIPLYRDYALRMGLASVSRESCENLLTHGGPNGEGMGRAITIVVGGARESLDANPYSLKLVLKRRKGFVKLAMRTGADLVPCLSFGENDLYDQLDSSQHPVVHKVQLLVKQFMGFTVPLFHARGVFNYDVGLMPYRRPVNIVVGRPIPIMQSAHPDPAYVDEIHSRYVTELLKIWEDWKDTFARQRETELEIIE